MRRTPARSRPAQGGLVQQDGTRAWSTRVRSETGRVLPRTVPGSALLLLALPVLVGCGGNEPIDDPTPLYGRVPIEYPLDLWDADVEGETLLRVRITDMGLVDSVEVVETSGYPAFDSAAVRGARQLRYSPARRGERRLTVWARVPVQFVKQTP